MDKNIISDKRTNRRKRTRKNYPSTRAGRAYLAMLRDKLGMDDACAKYATYLFGKAASSGFLTGRVLSHCAAACALLGCRRYNMHRTTEDVMRATGLERRDIYRTYRQLYERFDPDLPVQDPESYITSIADAAGINEEARREARRILAMVGWEATAGKGPVALAAGALYVACVRLGEKVMRRDIAKASGVALTTLTNRYNDLLRVVVAHGTRF